MRLPSRPTPPAPTRAERLRPDMIWTCFRPDLSLIQTLNGCRNRVKIRSESGPGRGGQVQVQLGPAGGVPVSPPEGLYSRPLKKQKNAPPIFVLLIFATLCLKFHRQCTYDGSLNDMGSYSLEFASTVSYSLLRVALAGPHKQGQIPCTTKVAERKHMQKDPFFISKFLNFAWSMCQQRVQWAGIASNRKQHL